jgi:hypothetical protein
MSVACLLSDGERGKKSQTRWGAQFDTSSASLEQAQAIERGLQYEREREKNGILRLGIVNRRTFPPLSLTFPPFQTNLTASTPTALLTYTIAASSLTNSSRTITLSRMVERETVEGEEGIARFDGVGAEEGREEVADLAEGEEERGERAEERRLLGESRASG